MKFSIPFYVQANGRDEKGQLTYSVRLLFGQLIGQEQDWVIRAPLLEKAWQLSMQRVHNYIAQARQVPDLVDLTSLTYSPRIGEHSVNFTFEHSKKIQKCRMLVVAFAAMGQRLVFAPHLPWFWFTWQEKENLDYRTEEALKIWARQRAKTGAQFDWEEVAYQENARAWVQYGDFEVAAPGTAKPPSLKSLLAILGAPEPTLSGSRELQKVGRDLDRENLESPRPFLGRESELQSLLSWRQSEKRSALAVVGPRLVGKSALVLASIAEYSRWQSQMAAPGSSEVALGKAHKKRRKKLRAASRGRHWLLNPGRLISGMSYLGQWENRLLSILRYARAHDLVLVFDDLVGLLSAGVSRDSSLNVAQVLKSFLVRGELRVIAQCTNEELQLVRERDRSLADLFEILPLQATTPKITRQVALSTARYLEDQQGATIDLEAVYLAVELADRYWTFSSQPGKSARFLAQLTARYRNETIDEAKLFQWFSQNSGLRPELLELHQPLPAEAIRPFFEDQIRGQALAVEQCVEVVSILRARLGTGGRPLASLLFIGPTGVGKTECAKTLATYLFGNPERLVRFDMNEFLGGDALARLVGTFDRPEGLLTEAVRSEPFCVILLDEIEKADPCVLLLLLQILGDGRLTDARGRSVDFSQTVVVMTSNLGADQVSKNLGVRQRRQQDELIYRRAVADFFPPELFNRIDRIVPFSALSKATVAEIAERVWHKLLSREGFRRRQCLLEVDSAVQSALVEAGFHPELGARALKRAVEEKVVAPVAQKLARLTLDGLVLLRIGSTLDVSVLQLHPANRAPIHQFWRADSGGLPREPEWLAPQLLLAEQTCKVWAEQLASWREHNQGEQTEYLYFELQEEQREVSQRLTRLLSLSRLEPGKRRLSLGERGSTRLSFHSLSESELQALLGGEDFYTSLQRHQQNLLEQPLVDATIEGLASLAWSQLRFAEIREVEGECSQPLRISGSAVFARQLNEWLEVSLGLLSLQSLGGSGASSPPRRRKTVEKLDEIGDLTFDFPVQGPGARVWLAGESGLHLFIGRHGFRTVWLQDPTGPPFHQEAPIVRIYTDFGMILDVATGLFCRIPAGERSRAMTSAALAVFAQARAFGRQA